MIPTARKLSEDLRELQTSVETFTLQGLLDRVGDRGVLLVIILLNLPFCLPIPLPGLSTPFGFALMLLAVRLGVGLPERLPHSLGSREIPPPLLHTLLEKALWLCEKGEKVIRPRFQLVFSSNLDRLHSLVIFILAFLLSLPLMIPSTNIAPAIGILFLAVGMIERDGFLLIIGYIAAIIGIVYLGFLFDVILNSTEKIIEWIGRLFI